jgi:hypothetical protein
VCERKCGRESVGDWGRKGQIGRETKRKPDREYDLDEEVSNFIIDSKRRTKIIGNFINSSVGICAAVQAIVATHII